MAPFTLPVKKQGRDEPPLKGESTPDDSKQEKMAV